MCTISLQDIQRDLHGFLRRVEAGEALRIVNGDHAVAEVRPMTMMTSEPRPYGLGAGQFTVPDDFDAPLPEKILQEFEGP